MSNIKYGLVHMDLLLCVHYYSAPSVSFYVKITSVLTWVLNFGLALLVPEDLYYTLTHFG
jgi:hypothetical protein